MGNLFKLEQLDLSHNKLTGAIPPELGNLSNLKVLNLGSNPLNGVLPPDLGKLSKLQYLFLSFLRLTEVPPELGNLSELVFLALDYNELRSIPPELGKLSKLQQLRLDYNKIEEIPPELGDLQSLVSLQFSGNQLRSIPPELGKLSSLKYMNLRTNQLSEIPPELGNLSSLENLSLEVNKLSGEIPPELGNLRSLAALGLSSNQLSGSVPLSFVNLDLYVFEYQYTNLCVQDDEDFLGWLRAINRRSSTGPICATSGMQGVANVVSGRTDTLYFDKAGAHITLTDPSATDGLLTANRIEREVPLNRRILNTSVSAPGGDIQPNVVSPDRHWFITAPKLTEFSYNICLDITNLPNVNKPDLLVLAQRRELSESWMPLNTTLKADGSFTYLCAMDLNSTSFFAIGANTQDNPLDTPLPVEENPDPDPETDPEATAFGIESVFPNPFQAHATLRFTTDRQEAVRLELYNVQGQHMRTLYEGMPGVGVEQVVSLDGSGLPSGLYLVRLLGEGRSETRTLMRVK